MAGKPKFADAAEPLVLADGTKIAADGTVIRDDQKFVEVPTNREAQRLIVSTRRKLTDFTTPPKQLNLLAVVASYTLCGLNDDEIAVATSTTLEQISRLKMTDAYGEFERTVIDGIKESDVADVRGLIVSHSRNAAERIAGLVSSSDDAIALHASKDILDRSGHRPADVVEHRHSMEGELRIRYVDDRETNKAPTIELVPVE